LIGFHVPPPWSSSHVSPLCSNYGSDSVARSLLHDYAVPPHFPEDLFSLVGERRRPPYRWFLLGPARSGTCVHIDPLGTSAWNTVIQGRKRWVLFPPEVSKSIAKGTDVLRKGEDDESVNFFVDLLPRLREKYVEPFWPLFFDVAPCSSHFALCPHYVYNVGTRRCRWWSSCKGPGRRCSCPGGGGTGC